MSNYNLTKQDIIELLLIPTFNGGALMLYDMYVQGTSSEISRYDAGLMFGSTLVTSVIDKLLTTKLNDVIQSQTLKSGT